MNAVDSAVESALEQQQKRAGGKRWFLRGLLAVVAAAIVMQVAYTFSSSDDWQLVNDIDGMQIYSKKISGQNIKQFKGVFEMRGALDAFYLAMVDPVVSDSHAVGWSGGREIARESEFAFWTAWKAAMPRPFTDRQYVVKHEFSQNKENKQFLYKVISAPEKLPPDECCVRVPVMGNSWTLTPSGSDRLRVEWEVDMNLGGMIPYFVQNQRIPMFMRNMPPVLQRMVENEKYRNASQDVRAQWIVR